MGRECDVHGEKIDTYRGLTVKPESDHLKSVGVDRMIILKWF
jgi:hypothetical protein